MLKRGEARGKGGGEVVKEKDGGEENIVENREEKTKDKKSIMEIKKMQKERRESKIKTKERNIQ